MADSGQQQAPSSAKTPADFLKSIKGKPVVVKLNSGVDYRGGGPGTVLQAGGRRRQPRQTLACRTLPSAPACSSSLPRPYPSHPQACWPAWTAT